MLIEQGRHPVQVFPKNETALFFIFLFSIFQLSQTYAQERVVKLKLVQTSDVHGNFFPYDFIHRCSAEGSLARVYAFVQKEREVYKDNLILLDNGDILQGQPSAYYYNYIDTVSPHLSAEMLNFMGYDAGNVGNHDVETGRPVFERWAADCRFPVLSANVVDERTGETLFKPYKVIEREGVKIVVLGLVTPVIPMWLPKNLWDGLRFEDMEVSARAWMKVIREQERPDVVVGLFHSGKDAQWVGGRYRDNASVEVACKVPGFDVVLIGHDHVRECKKVVNVEGDSVLIVNPANNALAVGDVELTVTMREGKVVGKQVEGRLSDVRSLKPDRNFTQRFSSSFGEVSRFVSKKIGTFTDSISTRPAYFGPSAFVDLIHCLQLKISGADISLAAPLSFDAEIKAGNVYVADMFSLYKYENMLYTMSLSGREIHGALEMSYALWTNQMHSPSDHLLLLQRHRANGDDGRAFFQYPSYNFDSAAGIIYTVDVTRPAGEKVCILSMADGTPFEMDKYYKVAVNSYRGNGGGELLTKGAGISHDELQGRILYSTDRDLRYYLMRYIESMKFISPKSLDQWKFIPETFSNEAARRDYEYLFGK